MGHTGLLRTPDGSVCLMGGGAAGVLATCHTVGSHAQDSDWKKRHAALICLSQVLRRAA